MRGFGCRVCEQGQEGCEIHFQSLLVTPLTRGLNFSHPFSHLVWFSVIKLQSTGTKRGLNEVQANNGLFLALLFPPIIIFQPYMKLHKTIYETACMRKTKYLLKYLGLARQKIPDNVQMNYFHVHMGMRNLSFTLLVEAEVTTNIC